MGFCMKTIRKFIYSMLAEYGLFGSFLCLLFLPVTIPFVAICSLFQFFAYLNEKTSDWADAKLRQSEDWTVKN